YWSSDVCSSDLGGHDGVLPLVHITAHVQVVHFAGPVHELPDAGGPYPGFRPRVQGRLDDGQVFYFQGDVLVVQLLFKKWEIELAGGDHALHQVPSSGQKGFDDTFQGGVIGNVEGTFLVQAGQAGLEGVRGQIIGMVGLPI